jgi:hypothetical protein
MLSHTVNVVVGFGAATLMLLIIHVREYLPRKEAAVLFSIRLYSQFNDGD